MLTQAAMQGRARSGLICLACRHAHDLLEQEAEEDATLRKKDCMHDPALKLPALRC